MAQQFRPRWVNALGGGTSGICQVFDIATDKQNNVYIAGNFSSDTIDFDPGPGVKYLKSEGNEDIFLGKYKPDGSLVWVESFASLKANPDVSGSATARSIALDKDGNITIAGGLADTLDADPGPGVHYLTPSQGGGLIIHLDNNGNLLWATAIGAGIEQVATDSQDDVIVSTTFTKTTIVGDSTYTSPAGLIRGLVVKYSSTGNVLWSVCLQNNDPQINQRADGCCVDSHDNVIVSGTFNYTVNFNPLGAPVLINAPNRREAFIAKYTPSGIFNWIDTVNVNQGIIYDVYYPVIGVDQQDNVLFESSFEDFATFNNTIKLNAQGPDDLCFAKYSPSGALQFAKSIGGPTGQVYSLKIVGDKDENIYLSGIFYNTVNFNPGPGNPQNLTLPDQGSEGFVAEYDKNGNYNYAFGVGEPLCGKSYALSLTTDQSGNVDIGGQFCSTVNFDPTGCSALKLTAISTYFADGFFAQYASTILSNDLITAPSATTFCTSGTPEAIIGSAPLGGVGGYTYQWQNSTDSVTFTNIPGADSINYTPPTISATTYYRRLVSQTCADTLNSNVVGLYIDSPPAAPQAAADTICSGGSATLSTIAPQQGTSYNWYAGATTDTLLFTGTSYSTPALTTGTTYYVSASTGSGCVSATRTAVTINVLPPLSTPLVTVDSTTATSVTFTWTAVSGATGYLVSTDGGQTFTSPSSGALGLTNTISGLQPNTSATLIVSAIGSRACQVSDNSAAVTAATPPNDLIYVPNAFTPNGDGKNDQVHVHSESIQSMTFYIYDQWGELLFTSTDMQNGWDGTYKGTKQPVGVYVYYLQATMIDGQKITKKGTITLIR